MPMQKIKANLQGDNTFYKDIISSLIEKTHSKKQINQLKTKLCGKYHLKKIPTDIDIMLNASEKELKTIKKYLLTKPMRSRSGVTPIAVMSAPYSCPHGKCTFCPGGPGSEFGDVPQSYTGHEPSTMRAIRANYDSYIIVFNRLEQFVVSGHIPHKAEVIIQGGTLPGTPREYQINFVKDIYQALNDFGAMFFKKTKEGDIIINLEKVKTFFELPGDIGREGRQERMNKKILKVKNEKATTLEKEEKKNETAVIRCVGLTIETKPDWGFAEHGNLMLELGATRVELGIQSVYEDALKITHRGHTRADSIRSIKELKDLGFKLNFHYMLGLPSTTKEMDIVGLRTLFDSVAYKPDMLKIYPCMVMKGTPLYHVWKAGKYQPMTTATAAEITADFMRYVPPYCRIMRVQRDIPTNVTEAGVDKTNLRQYIEKIMQEKNITTKEIRAREVGTVLEKNPDIKFNTPEIVVQEYEASNGKEFFVSLEDIKNDTLFGFVRLRFPSQCIRKEITETSALIRELHVYGEATALGKQGTVQHRGMGKQLMKKAEEIALQHGKDKIVVISAVGTREYYKKLGYEREGVYMVKRILKY
ncbi:tRNA uridine(34) 5-carboxymethylaminomethyl modification radical SAM/GNAT enzyme Elp3 [Candidatus Woesearchaeota archaeon]|nr:tRNA uridine(34) 5-carboxymethylaminomethyl modification radical SAM/GNAT enzyme Elp3 [Candidatus Woesearchaeota archaeon]